MCNLDAEAEELGEYDFPDEVELEPEVVSDGPWDD